MYAGNIFDYQENNRLNCHYVGIGLHLLQENIASLLSGNSKFICTVLVFGICLLLFLFLYFFKARDYILLHSILSEGVY